MKWFYDLEVFPNLFCVTFKNADTGEERVFGVYGDRDGREKLRTFLDQPMTLIGFNNISYDGPVLYAMAYLYRNQSPSDALWNLFQFSAKLIDGEGRFDDDVKRCRYPRGIKYNQLDLMKILAFDALGVGLKQTAINLRWHRIQDLPLPYDQDVLRKDVQVVLDYNRNDVLITQELYKHIQPQIKLRQELSTLYGVDLMNASDSMMANILLEKIYTQSGQDVRALKDKRTKRQHIRLVDCLGKNIEFTTPIMQDTFSYLNELVLSPQNKYGFKRHVKIGKTTYDLGIGGIHSRDKAGKFLSNSDFIIRDADVASYYPNIIIQNGLTPAHLGSEFVTILRQITQERLAAKKAGEKAKADGLKITVNSIFGKTNSDTFWLEDILVFLSVTISGQLYLLMLIEALEGAGIEVISANTDGIVSRIPVRLEDTYRQICEWWQHKTGFELEFTDYSIYVRSDVNNYLTVKGKGESKAKGRYVQDVDLKKGYKYPIVARCLYEYFVNGQSVDDTLSGCTDILDFCISQKTGGKFQLEYHTVGSVEVLQKTNRFYIANSGGVLIKRNKDTHAESGLYVGETVQLLNTHYDELPFDNYDVNLDFYRNEAQKYIEEIEPSIVQMGFAF